MCGERCKMAQEKNEQAQTQEAAQENKTSEKKQVISGSRFLYKGPSECIELTFTGGF